MPQADVIQLVTDFTDGFADTQAATNFYGDVVQEVGQDPDATIVNIIAFGGIAGQPDYDPSTVPINTVLITDIVNPLALIYDGVHLAKTHVFEATYYDEFFRVTKGFPRAWMEEDANRRAFSVVPVPDISGSTGSPYDPTGVTPLHERDFVLIYSQTRTDVHLEEELPLALEVAARELSRDSDHTDRTFAEVSRTLAGIFYKMVGVGISTSLEAKSDAANTGESAL
jgi:hypothetical protein